DHSLMSRVEDIAARARADEDALRRRNARVDAMTALRKAEEAGRDVSLEDLRTVTRTSEDLQSRAQAPQKEEDKDEAAEPEPLTYHDLVWRKGGLTPLHFAARDGSVRTARLLMDAGADLNRQSGGDFSTP